MMGKTLLMDWVDAVRMLTGVRVWVRAQGESSPHSSHLTHEFKTEVALKATSYIFIRVQCLVERFVCEKSSLLYVSAYNSYLFYRKGCQSRNIRRYRYNVL
jgi:hypothetical protein